MTDQPEVYFAGLLRQLRVKAGLTQEELAEAARLSPRSISDLERGINKTARKDTALLLADALNLAQPAREMFVQAARGRTAVADVLAALSALRNNLPAPVDSFVGRQAELAEIHDAVRAHRLVTLAGPGGSGKTRLALEAAASLVPAFADGVWLVALAAVSDGSRLPETVAQALHVADRPGETVADTLEGWLRDRELLLILDNCEHLVAAVASLCERLLPACHRLRILTTSRQFLGVRGERATITPPLAVPDDPALAPLSDAVQLFLERAAAVTPAFRPHEVDLGIVLEVCRRLDGLPLAIELAAARLRALSLPQLATRLDDRFWGAVGRTTGSRAGDTRPRSLESVVAWSYDLLSEPEQLAFARLAVFGDQFTLDMAEAVIADPPVDALDVVDVLASLVDKSLVTTVSSPDGLRYRLLEMLRQFGRGRLAERGEVDRYFERLLGWAMTGVERLEATIRTPAMDDALRQAAIDAVTYRAAMQWAAAHGQEGAALRIASMVPLSHHRQERRDLITDHLALAAESGQLNDAAAGHAWAAVANLGLEQGDWTTASAAGAQAATHFRVAGLSLLAAWGQYIAMHGTWGAGQLAEVDRMVGELIATFRAEHDEMGVGYSLWVASLCSPDLAVAAEMAAEADGLLRRNDVPMGVAHNVEGRGIIAFERGELGEAAGFVAEAVESFSAYGNLGCAAHVLEAAAVIVDAGGHDGNAVAVSLLAAASEFRRQSGQGHRPWEIRARLGNLEDRFAARLTPHPAGAARPAAARYTLAGAASVATAALRGLMTPTARLAR